MDQIENWIEHLLINSGVSEEVATYLRLAILLVCLCLVAGITFWLTKKIIVNYIYRMIRKSPITWDDVLADHQVFNNFAHIVPAFFVRALTPSIFQDFESLSPFVVKLTDVYILIVGTSIVISFLRVIEYGLSKSQAFKDKPLTSYAQLVRLILYIASGILILSVLLGKSPIYFLSAFGAMTAILLLIFKDTILGLVASVQISSNDMVRIGDWVEMPKFNADGDVIAMNLNTVKVQNWDKTITTIPTYYFITDSFKNWRGMQESGGRRIKRAVYVNSQTINFVDPETRERYKKYALITDYVSERQEQIEAYNTINNIDTSELINGRRMTNLGVFRKYLELYLHSHPKIRKDLTILVRQLTIEDRGIPIEIYCFTQTTAWLEYEDIQADIFDHVLAGASYFGLEIFQQPSGADIVRASKNIHQIPVN
ncbi:mechanosensitive ion channel family protein [Algoriphagus terrigena]|uniref:mechanosensitive ion channel family protein n=1 Tax=Algoriphagus terrigena TaxID=344884 RepID=UPI0004206D46|nr:mechanosensitive ion channel domain-containing protein [Algoriphagus terrigena]